MRLLASRLLSFGALPILGSLSPLLVLPLLARVLTPNEWTSLLAGQAIGAFASTVIMFGWGQSGQARIALSRTSTEPKQIYAESLRSRALVFSVVAPAASLLTWIIADRESALLATSMCLASTTFGFSMAWYGIGSGRAALVALYDAVPKLLAAGAAVGLVLLTGNPATYPLMVAVMNVGAIIVFNRRTFGEYVPRPRAGSRATGSADWRLAISSVLGSSYASAPLPIAAAIGGAAAPGVASMDRLYRYGVLALTAFSSATHAWTLSDDSVESRRQKVTLTLHVVVGLCGALGIAILGRPVAILLFGEDLSPSLAAVAAYGAAFAFVATNSTLVQNVLIPHKRSGLVVIATVVSATVGLPLMAIFGVMFGADAVPVALALSELLCLAILVGPALLTISRLNR